MLDRTIAPSVVEPKKFNLPVPKYIQFKNGSQFFFLNIGDQPVIKLEFIFKAGSWFESSPGIAFFAAKMLTEGTISFFSKQIAERLDQYGAFVDISPGFDYINFSVNIPTHHYRKIESVIHEILFNPTFPEKELELMKKIQIQQLSVNEKKNNFVASRLFRSKLYQGSPYGNVLTEKSIIDINTKSIGNHFDKWVKGKFDIFVTGNFDRSFQRGIIRSFEKYLSPTNKFESKDFKYSKHFDEYHGRKESFQSAIFMGKRSIGKDHKDFSQLLLLNEVFGGYFGSRLMQNIREDKGLTYGIQSHLVSMKNDAYFVINSEVKKENKDLAVEEIQNEIEKLKNELISNKELAQVKSYLKGSIINTLTTPFAITEKWKNIYFYNLENNFYDNLFDKIDQTSSEELLRLANDLLFDKPLSSVIVG